MKSVFKRFLATALCILMFTGILQVNAAGTVTTFKLYSLNTYSGPAGFAVVAGDINGDGEADNKDLTRLFQYLSEWDNIEVNTGALDVNGDNSVDNKDLTRLFQYLSDWEVEIFPKPVLCEHTGGVATCHTKAVCELCGEEYGDFDPDNHDGGTEIRGDYPATCIANGYTGDICCSGCGAVLSRGDLTDPTGIHLRTALQNEREATCSTLGYTGDLVCLDCGMVLERGSYTDESNVHLHTHRVNAVEPTCTDYGFTGDLYCDDCGKCIEWGTDINPTGHIHTDYLNGYPATCTDYGYEGDICCTDCGAFVRTGEILEPTGHRNKELRNVRPVTCTEAGYTGDEYCLDCGEILTHGTYTEPTGHIGGSATYYQKAVCDTCHEEYGQYAQMLAYDSLNYNQKGIYRALSDWIYNMSEDFISVWDYVDLETYEDDIYIAFKAVSCDRPDIFWMPRNILIASSYIESTGEITDVGCAFKYTYIDEENEENSISIDYPISPDDKAWMQQVLEEKLQDAENRTIGLETDFEKEVAIHDYLCELISYDQASANASSGLIPDRTDDPYATFDPTDGSLYYAYQPMSWTAYGALANGLAVCEGYSRAMQLICQRVGIPCGLVTGQGMRIDDADEEKWEAHMWNIINPGDGCYYLDVTFDDPTGYSGPPVYNYFNLDESSIKKDHMFDQLFRQDEQLQHNEYESPDLNFFETHGDNTALNYYNFTGAYILAQDATKAAEYMLSEYSKGNKTTFVIRFNNNSNDTTEVKAQQAYNALSKALRGKLILDARYSYTGNSIIVTVIGNNTH